MLQCVELNCLSVFRPRLHLENVMSLSSVHESSSLKGYALGSPFLYAITGDYFVIYVDYYLIHIEKDVTFPFVCGYNSVNSVFLVTLFYLLRLYFLGTTYI